MHLIILALATPKNAAIICRHMRKPYVTVHAKTSLVRTKIEINFLSPAYSYTH